MFTFNRTDWMDPPVFKQIDPSLNDSVYRRHANDALYRQISSPSKWQKYVALGYYAVDDGAVFDLDWCAREANPTKMHSIIWYNYLYHIDRDLDIPTKLNAWATQVSQPYLLKNAPHLLTTDTHSLTWSQIQTHNTPMEVVEDEWTEVISTGKAKATKRRDSSSLATAAAEVPPNTTVTNSSTPDTDTPRSQNKTKTIQQHTTNQEETKNADGKNEFSSWLNDRTSTETHTPWGARKNPSPDTSTRDTRNNQEKIPPSKPQNQSTKDAYISHP